MTPTDRSPAAHRPPAARVELPAPQVPEPPSDRTRHPFFMHDMIRRQAVAARATLRATAESLTATPLAGPTGSIAFVGLGTSYHAAIGAAYAAQREHPEWAVRAASAFDVLDGELDRVPDVAIVFSASGATALTVDAQRHLRSLGARVVLVTSEEGGPSWREADRVLLTQHAKDASWTHTVASTTALH